MVVNQIADRIQGLSLNSSRRGLKFVRIEHLTNWKVKPLPRPSWSTFSGSTPSASGKGLKIWHTPFIITTIVLLIVTADLFIIVSKHPLCETNYPTHKQIWPGLKDNYPHSSGFDQYSRTTIQYTSRFGQDSRTTIQHSSGFDQYSRTTIQHTSRFGQDSRTTIQHTSRFGQHSRAAVQN